MGRPSIRNLKQRRREQNDGWWSEEGFKLVETRLKASAPRTDTGRGVCSNNEMEEGQLSFSAWRGCFPTSNSAELIDRLLS